MWRAVPRRGLKTAGHRLRAWAGVLIVAFVALFATSVQAQTVVTLVSNTGQTTASSAASMQSQGFTTGSASSGYTVTGVGVSIAAGSVNQSILVRIFSVDNDGEPDSLEHTLSIPTIVVDAVNMFTAPADATLDAETTYAVVVSSPDGTIGPAVNVNRTSTSAEDAGAAAGWSIEDTRYWRSSDTAAWSSSTTLMQISVHGYAKTTTTSTDATLSDLELQDTSDDSDIALTPTFASDVTSYTASVDNAVSEILVDPTTNDDGATVEFLDADDMAIDDAQSMEDGHQVALAVGANTIKVKVTAEDTTIEETYTVVVTRAAAANTDATGAPVISGTAQSGKTLTAGIGTIVDDDGLPGTFPDDYTFQWVRVDSDGVSNPVNIGSDDDEYTLVDADVGKRVTVKVSFTDDGGTAEGPLESEAYPAAPLGATVVAAKGTCPTVNDWCATLTTGYAGTTTSTVISYQFGFSPLSTFGDLDPTMFTRGATDYTVTRVHRLLNTTTDGNTVLGDALTFTKTGGTLPDGTVLNLGGTVLTVGTDTETSTAGQEQWDLKTLGISLEWVEGQEIAVSLNLAPVLTGATVDGDTLVLTYDEALDTTSPGTAAYSVTVDSGTPAAPSSVDISGSTVTLTLASAVTSGQTVTVTYTVPGSNPVQDESGIEAAAFTDEAVTNNTGASNTPATGAPVISGAPQVDETLTAGIGSITDSDGLPSGTFPTGYSFQWVRVDSDGASNPVDIGTDSSTYTPVTADIGKKILVKVSFTDGGNTVETVPSEAYPSQGYPSTAIGVVAAKSTCPSDAEWCEEMTVGHLEQAGTNLYGYSGITPNVFGDLDSTSIMAGGEAYTVIAIRLIDGPVHDEVDVTLDAFLPLGSIFTLGGTEFTMDADSRVSGGNYGWDIPAGVGMVVGQKMTVSTNLSPVLTGATVDGDTLVLTYHEDLEVTPTLPAASDFTVMVDSTAAAVSSVDISGTEVTLTLATAVTNGQTVTVSYAPGINPIQDESGLEAAAFTDEPVTNNTGASNTPATGAPVISGAPQVNETLTAGIGSITDSDGLPSTTFPAGYSFQWVRVDSDGASNPVDIGTDSSTYTPVAADIGKRILVKVSFTDGGNTVETVPSEAYPSQGYPSTAITIVPEKAACPSGYWCTEMTVGFNSGANDIYGFEAGSTIGTVTAATFSQGTLSNELEGAYITDSTGTDTVTVETTQNLPAGSFVYLGGRSALEADIDTATRGGTGLYYWSVTSGFGWVVGQKVTLGLDLAPLLIGATVNGSTLVLTYSEPLDTTSPGTAAYTVKVDSGTGTAPSSVDISGSEVTLTLASAVTSGQTVTVTYTPPGTDPVQDENGLKAAAFTDEPVINNTGVTANATGATEITGPAQRGRTLTAGMGDIEDTDGLPSGTFPAGYSFQWVRVNASDNETVIAGATGQTYTPEFADLGHTLKVRVSFTDGGGETETLPSAATNPVVPDAAPCPAGSVWCTVLTVGGDPEEEGGSTGFSTGRGSLGAIGSLVDDTFTFEGTTYTVTDVNAGGTQSIFLGTEPDLPADGAGLTFHVQRLNGTLDLALADSDLIFHAGLGGNAWQFVGVTETGPSNPLLLRVTTRVNGRYTSKTDPGTRVTVRLSQQPGASFGSADYTAAEGGADATVTVTLTPAPTSSVTIPITATGQGGATSADWTGIPASLIFGAGETSKTFTVTAVDDTDEDQGESVLLAFGTLPSGVPAGFRTTATVTLADNDGGVPGALRLMKGGVESTDGEGRLEVFYRGQWGTVCDDRFDSSFTVYDTNPPRQVENNAPALACQIMGYETGTMLRGHDFASAVTSQPIWLDDVRCEAGVANWNEGGDPPTRLDQCYNAGIGLHNCTHQEDVALQCTGVNPNQQVAAEPLTVQVRGLVPSDGHDGETPLTFELSFNQDVTISAEDMREHALDVGGATVTGAAMVDGRADLWEITLQPSGTDNVTITVPLRENCSDAGALCTGLGFGLTQGLFTMVPYIPAASTPALTAAFEGVPGEHDGSSIFALRLVYSEAVFDGSESFDKNRSVWDALSVSGGAIRAVRRVDSDQYDQWLIRIKPSGNGAVTVTLPAGGDCATGPCTDDGRALSQEVTATIQGPDLPGLSVADAEVEEGPGAKLSFAITLDRAASNTVTVEASTSDGTAIAGEDYRAKTLTKTFAPGETRKVAVIRVLDDSHDDDGETLTLTLSNPTGAYLADARATGTIHNADPLPAGWLARFGRAGATQVVDLLNTRFDEASTVQAGQMTLGGRAMSFTGLRGLVDRSGGGTRQTPAQACTAAPGRETAEPAAGQIAVTAAEPVCSVGGTSDPMASLSGRDTPASPATGIRGVDTADEDGAGQQTQPVGAAGGEATPLERALWQLLTSRGRFEFDKRRFISRSSFDLSLSGLGREEPSIETVQAAPDMPGQWSLWGRGAMTRFSGTDEDVNINGDVLTGLLGLDYARDRWLAGVALAYHDGDGGYRSARNSTAGGLDSTLITVNPYLRYTLADRLSVWGTLGYGTGTLQLRPEQDATSRPEAIDTDMQMSMGALGLRGTVYANAHTELALKSDALWVRTSSDETQGLRGVDSADTSRLRLLLAGSHQHSLRGGAALAPSVELGIRYDDGDAETGFGLELGGGLRYADPVLGLTVETRARALVAHEDSGYEEWGLSGSLALDPGRLGRGLALRLDSGWGMEQSGTESLWQRQTTAGIAPQHNQAAQGRFNVEMGYGLDVPWTHGMLTPYGGVEMAGSNRTMRLGWRFALGQTLSLSLDGERRESGPAPPEHTLMLRTSLPW